MLENSQALRALLGGNAQRPPHPRGFFPIPRGCGLPWRSGRRKFRPCAFLGHQKYSGGPPKKKPQFLGEMGCFHQMSCPKKRVFFWAQRPGAQNPGLARFPSGGYLPAEIESPRFPTKPGANQIWGLRRGSQRVSLRNYHRAPPLVERPLYETPKRPGVSFGGALTPQKCPGRPRVL